MADPICQAARGIILDSQDNWRIVCHSFDKFFNLGEPLAADVDWENCAVLEKLDGSLIQMFYYDGKWRVASSGSPDAGGDVQGHGITFAELFWNTFRLEGLELPETAGIDPDTGRPIQGWERFTFAWELMTPLNRVVVRHRDQRIVLIGIRDNVTGREYLPYVGPVKWPKVRSYPIRGIRELELALTKVPAVEREGFVVVDRNFNRVKVKSPEYVTLHQLRGNGSPTPKRALAAILAGEAPEVLAYFPEFADVFKTAEIALECMCLDLEQAYDAIKDIPSQKDFAAQALKTPCSGALFSFRAGKVASIRDFIRAMPLDRLASLLNLRGPDNDRE